MLSAAPVEWTDGPAEPRPPRPGELDLWLVRLPLRPELADGLGALLSDDERARQRRLLAAEDRLRFAAARGTLRRLLGAYLRTSARSLVFAEEEGGRPILADPALAARLRFNVSHSQDVALLAFAPGTAVGVDVECCRRELDCLLVARQFFSPEDHAALAALSPANLRRGFMELWTCKEAVLKALGRGLSERLDRVQVGSDDGRPVVSVGRETLPLLSFEPAPDYVGALAVNMGGPAPGFPRTRFYRAQKW
ncbi:MAG: 4'-phosphopantetheinyl transferase superfamily protein [Elusimicrobia bacterium]|nr:4'-phosphopantetheinyl transferase superfamily protein [Elusimicrobiota bacterium]